MTTSFALPFLSLPLPTDFLFCPADNPLKLAVELVPDPFLMRLDNLGGGGGINSRSFSGDFDFRLASDLLVVVPVEMDLLAVGKENFRVD
jgi:hypothetical protein